jgi:ribosomal protein S18 acetylase RimI-like enzyme
MEGDAGPADCQIRLLGQADLQAYKELRDAMLARHPDAFTSDAESELQRDAASYHNRLSGGNGGANLFTLVAWSGSAMVGAVSCEHETRIKVQHLAKLEGMMVSDAWQGQGIGGRLMAQALQMLRTESRLEQVTLTVTSSNLVAVRLYQRFGFSQYGCLPDAIRLPDGVKLAKDLMRLGLR